MDIMKLRVLMPFIYNNENLDRAVSQKDGKNYYSGTASYWINNINVEVCNKNEFVFADIFVIMHLCLLKITLEVVLVSNNIYI